MEVVDPVWDNGCLGYVGGSSMVHYFLPESELLHYLQLCCALCQHEKNTLSMHFESVGSI